VATTRALSDEQRERVLHKLSSRLDSDRNVRVVASDRRSQRQNRERAEARLAELVRGALIVPKKRRPTKPSRASKQARLESKKRQSDKKRDRRWQGD
jgi:ribosome-associated protein